MSLFHIGVATEANNYSEETNDQVWIRNENGKLVLVEDKEYEDN